MQILGVMDAYSVSLLLASIFKGVKGISGYKGLQIYVGAQNWSEVDVSAVVGVMKI